MKRLPIIISLLLALTYGISSCSKDDENNLEKYRHWRDLNINWYEEQLNLLDENGDPFYELIQPEWYMKSGVLMHWYNDRSLTAGNLVPYSTSTITIKYIGKLYNGVAFDSTFSMVDSVATMPLEKTIKGWKIALPQMHVGDSVDIIIPYEQAYGSSGSTRINPYSTLQFSVKLVDIPDYEIKGSSAQ